MLGCSLRTPLCHTCLKAGNDVLPDPQPTPHLILPGTQVHSIQSLDKWPVAGSSGGGSFSLPAPDADPSAPAVDLSFMVCPKRGLGVLADKEVGH